MVDGVRIPAIPLDVIVEAMAEDLTLQDVIHRLQTDRWRHLEEAGTGRGVDVKELTSFQHVKDELSVADCGLIIGDKRIVIPRALRQGIINLAHEGHRGVVATKRALRERVWFPTLDSLVESTLRVCVQCQVVGQEESPPLMQMS